MSYNLTDFYLFENCNKNLLDEISNNLLIRNAISGETIFNQGDVPKNLYIILEGSLYVTEFTEDGKAVAHELISKGDCFGEIAIIDEKLRSLHQHSVLPTFQTELLPGSPPEDRHRQGHLLAVAAQSQRATG